MSYRTFKRKSINTLILTAGLQNLTEKELNHYTGYRYINIATG